MEMRFPRTWLGRQVAFTTMGNMYDIVLLQRSTLMASGWGLDVIHSHADPARYVIPFRVPCSGSGSVKL
jgi:hypothetical protein